MTPVAATFGEHVAAVRKLMNFDRDVLDVSIQQIRSLRTALKQHHKLDNPQLTADNTLTMLEGIREHDSLRSRYETIFNQALVLLVSYFGSSAHDLFRRGVLRALDLPGDSQLLREELRVPVGDLKDVDFHTRDLIPELLVQAKDISFQDMQSIGRAFKNYLDVQIDRDSLVHDIIAAQACRHVIVHSGGLADERLRRQLASASPRRVKPQISLGEAIQFNPEEVEMVAASMSSYLAATSRKVAERVGAEV